MEKKFVVIPKPLIAQIMPWQDLGTRKQEVHLEDLLVFIFRARLVLQPTGVVALITSGSFAVVIEDAPWFTVEEQVRALDWFLNDVASLWLDEMKTVRKQEIADAREAVNQIPVRSKPDGFKS